MDPDVTEFWDDWRDHAWRVVTAPPVAAFGAVLLLVVARNAGRVDDVYGALLLCGLLIAAGGMLTFGVLTPLLLGWDLDAVLVRCSPEGITVKGVTHPWSTVRALSLGYEELVRSG
ncbi:hypothetical protein [Streptomyces sp. TRM64462]|uniref:hypothetical protein n=1 Tax=Streptomyces sp. TRM64462 TaxID=2741726 RepID=UPI001586A6A3|nr:hypothetical protein [Streptomyces sp. TRM64462]